ncbi:ABC transporter ATP-binding protein [Cupriavidus respiraculi]|uniref:Lipopolysaccharide export system ATP-binding protein LptB n=1 Tax=Cupriavidus respiraculi TaxID=195930 RepID=A0ABM8WWZ4_9BURK|nr:ABC transporter ATP-binding protein [Cupriavidus respiraculi]CAG9172036.1 Lipopolysaccharide export system ATP-binding protein LptB [Cupriavidus respiraculi]
MSEPVLAARRLTRRFGGLTAVGDVDLALHLHEIHAVIGTNGAGKSTLINMLSGELPPSEGQLFLHGDEVTGWSQPRLARAGVGRSYQRNNIFLPLTVRENCRLAAQSRAQRAWRLWESAQACRTSRALGDEALERAGLSACAALPAMALSHGQKRQLEVAMCLATQPVALLLDEPLAGMGAEESARMLALLQSLRDGHAILLVEHDMEAVFAVADRITVMVNGNVIASGDPAAIRTNSEVQQAYLGEDDGTAEGDIGANTGGTTGGNTGGAGEARPRACKERAA